MKKKIIALSIILCMTLTGCGSRESVINEYGNKVSKIGPYIEISHTTGLDYKVVFYTVYREDTKIVYEIAIYSNRYQGGISIHELHSYDDEGHPILQFYEEGKIVTKQNEE